MISTHSKVDVFSLSFNDPISLLQVEHRSGEECEGLHWLKSSGLRDGKGTRMDG